MAGGRTCSGRVPVRTHSRARVGRLSWDDDCEQWGVAGPDGLPETYGIGAATRAIACSEPSVLAGTHDGLPVRIGSRKPVKTPHGSIVD